MFNVTVGSEYEGLKEALLKKADVPHAVVTSSERSTLEEDLLAAGLDSPAITLTPAPAAVSPATGLFTDLVDLDGDLPRPGGSGLCSSAFDLHKSGLTSTSAFRRRFLRSRSHQNLLRIDVRATGSPSADVGEHLATATPKLFPSRSPRLLPTCVRRASNENANDCLSAPLDSAIRQSGSLILQICGIDLWPSAVTNKTRKSRFTNV